MMFTLNAGGTVWNEPLAFEGGFAVVYKFAKQSGQVCALRIMKVMPTEDQAYRYDRISGYFAREASHFTVNFKYYTEWLKVKGDSFMAGKAPEKVLPIIIMDWVDGPDLHEYVHICARKNDKKALGDLAEKWLGLLVKMRRARIAHMNLAGGNVKVTPDGKLILLDYDDVYIPEFSGKDRLTRGQPDYQHPGIYQMPNAPFNEYGDEFSALAIYTALLALRERPELWKPPHVKLNDKGELVSDNLLFTQNDYKHPGATPLFKEIRAIASKDVTKALDELESACRGEADKFHWNPDPDADKSSAEGIGGIV